MKIEERPKNLATGTLGQEMVDFNIKRRIGR